MKYQMSFLAKTCLSQQKVKIMVWYFIGVYIINRTLHGHVEIRNFSCCVEKYFQYLKAM